MKGHTKHFFGVPYSEPNSREVLDFLPVQRRNSPCLQYCRKRGGTDCVGRYACTAEIYGHPKDTNHLDPELNLATERFPSALFPRAP